MPDPLDLELLDADGAIREAGEAIGLDRGDFLKRGALAGGSVLAGSALMARYAGSAEAAISKTKLNKANDLKVLNFALTLEYLEAEFYKQALANQAYGDSSNLKRFAEVVARHEATHVKFLQGVLKAKAVKKPTFDFGKAVTDQATFAATAQTLEDTGVSAYLGQVTNISTLAVLGAAGTIATVEARHASWIRFVNGKTPAPASFDVRKSEQVILEAVKATGFIK
jgi:rubrerythrin